MHWKITCFILRRGQIRSLTEKRYPTSYETLTLTYDSFIMFMEI